jgi:hypothetical protein
VGARGHLRHHAARGGPGVLLRKRGRLARSAGRRRGRRARAQIRPLARPDPQPHRFGPCGRRPARRRVLARGSAARLSPWPGRHPRRCGARDDAAPGPGGLPGHRGRGGAGLRGRDGRRCRDRSARPGRLQRCADGPYPDGGRRLLPGQPAGPADLAACHHGARYRDRAGRAPRSRPDDPAAGPGRELDPAAREPAVMPPRSSSRRASTARRPAPG